MAADAIGVWRVTGMGTLGRQIPTKHVNVPSTSQFFTKADGHEQAHIDHWSSGQLLGGVHQPADFYARIQNFTGTSQQDLLSKITAEFGCQMLSTRNTCINFALVRISYDPFRRSRVLLRLLCVIFLAGIGLAMVPAGPLKTVAAPTSDMLRLATTSEFAVIGKVVNTTGIGKRLTREQLQKLDDLSKTLGGSQTSRGRCSG